MVLHKISQWWVLRLRVSLVGTLKVFKWHLDGQQEYLIDNQGQEQKKRGRQLEKKMET